MTSAGFETAQMARRVQLFGQRCSGTHYVAKLVEANTTPGTFTERFGFKHWFADPGLPFDDDVLVCVVARNVFDWIRSLHRQPWHVHPRLKSLSLTDFLLAEWHAVWDEDWWGLEKTDPRFGTEMLHERDPKSGRRFASPIAMRTAKLAHWSRLDCAHLWLCDYDEIAANPGRFVNDLRERLGIAPKSIVTVDSYKGLGEAQFQPSSYAPLTSEQIALIERAITPEIEHRYGLPSRHSQFVTEHACG